MIESTHKLLDDLGFERVIWIDDFFEISVDHIKGSLMLNPEILKGLAVTGFETAIELSADMENIGRFETELINALSNVSVSDLETLNEGIRNYAALLENNESTVDSPDHDLGKDSILAACKILRVDEGDRLGFEKGLLLLENLTQDGKKEIAFVVDLQNAFQAEGRGSGAEAGIEVLKKIYAREVSETVFVLTHEASIETEAEKEAQIAEKITEETVDKPIPCVIAKERIAVNTEKELCAGIQVAMKRASLRHEVFRVGKAAEKNAALAIKEARANMCMIPPEELDGFFVKRAIMDGASDLHMIERIFTAQAASSIRNMFVEDEEVKTALQRMRILRDVQLQPSSHTTHPVITKFRQDEIWYEGDFLRAGYAPLVQGDVFTTINDPKRTFILLGQPCDITLRNNGKRSAFSCELVEFKHLDEAVSPFAGSVSGDRKTIDLRVGENQSSMRFDFRNASATRLDILDLATFNAGGEVKIMSDQEAEVGLLPGQKKAQERASKLFNSIVSAEKKKPAEIAKAWAQCRLVLQTDRPFNKIAMPEMKENDNIKSLDWNLIRICRLRSPYVDILIDQQLALLSRRALDIDYLPEE